MADPGSSLMFCRQCNKVMDGGNPNHCANCGTAFDPANPGSFKRQVTLPARHWYWLLALPCLGVIVALCLTGPWGNNPLINLVLLGAMGGAGFGFIGGLSRRKPRHVLATFSTQFCRYCGGPADYAPENRCLRCGKEFGPEDKLKAFTPESQAKGLKLALTVLGFLLICTVVNLWSHDHPTRGTYLCQAASLAGALFFGYLAQRRMKISKWLFVLAGLLGIFFVMSWVVAAIRID
jgi:hypothetical protein